MKAKIFKQLVAVYILLMFSATNIHAQEVWQPVGSGLGTSNIAERVNALLNDTIHNVLYAAGSFSVINDTTGCGGLAMWNGVQWSTNLLYSGGGIPSQTCLALLDGNVYVGGSSSVFYDNNGIVSPEIGNFNGPIRCLAAYNGKLYAGGAFTKVNGVTAQKIACWNGQEWKAVGGGVYWSRACCGSVDALCVWRGKLIAGGIFDHAVNGDSSEILAGSIAVWNDTSWSATGELVIATAAVETGHVYSLGVYKDELCAGGWFDSAGGVFANAIARWDGSNWHSFGEGIRGTPVLCMTTKDSSLYIGGIFSSVGNLTDTYGLGRWGGTTWHRVGPGFNASIYSMCVYNGELYLGGNFDFYTSHGIVRLVDITGIQEPDNTSGAITLYPNPAANHLTVTAGEEGGTWTIQDLLGRTVLLHTTPIHSTQTQIDISRLPPGLYVLKVKTQSGSRVTKFVKQ